MKPWRRLEDGRIYLNYGPVQMLLSAERDGTASVELAELGARRAVEAFTELCENKEEMRKAAELLPDSTGNAVLDRMAVAARKTRDPAATPMLAVAGCIAQEACDAMRAGGADWAFVNNGGDIALLASGLKNVTVGIMTDVGTGQIAYQKTVAPSDGIGGVATSGLGGRSMTCGIASAAVAFAHDAATADACATILGNAATVNDSRVHRKRALELDQNTDIPDLMVTVSVDPLPPPLARKALTRARTLAESYIERGMLLGAVITVQGQTVMVPEHFCEAVTERKG
ncbi:MAG: hypothetical protein VB112_02180 [Oscillospiraceae bacterium]|nr:hypothetical protein [Oscillospiraceae bacterium]